MILKRISFIFSSFIVILLNNLLVSVYGSTKLKFEGDTVEFECQSDESKNVMWIAPNSRIITKTSDPGLILQNGTLIIDSLKSTDAGKYVCLKIDNGGSSSPAIIDQHVIPYVIVRKDHLRSFYIALGVSGGFLLSVIGLYLLSEFKWTKPKTATEMAEHVDEFRYYPADPRRQTDRNNEDVNVAQNNVTLADNRRNPERDGGFVNNIQISDTAF